MDKNSNNNMFIGIDVSKDTLDISINCEHYKINNTKKAILAFIKANIASKKVQLCVLESTGGYERLVLQLMQEANIPCHRAHPNKVYNFAKAAGHFAKTDKLDAKLLERYASFVSDEEKGDLPLSDIDYQLKALRSVEKDLEESLHASQCRIQHAKGKAYIYIKKQIDFIKNQLLNIQEDIQNLIDNDPTLKNKQKILTSYKGVGKKVSSVLIAELPELGKLNKKEIASLVGVAPKTNESGKKIRNSHIFGGRFFVRKALYMSALVASRYDDKMCFLYKRLVEKGKVKKLALVAVMRKIIICLNSMLKNNTIYA